MQLIVQGDIQRLTLTLDVFKYIFECYNPLSIKWLTLTLDVFK